VAKGFRREDITILYGLLLLMYTLGEIAFDRG